MFSKFHVCNSIAHVSFLDLTHRKYFLFSNRPMTNVLFFLPASLFLEHASWEEASEQDVQSAYRYGDSKY